MVVKDFCCQREVGSDLRADRAARMNLTLPNRAHLKAMSVTNQYNSGNRRRSTSSVNMCNMNM